ncbi:MULTISPECIES: iron donor protein CyaY [Comamonas]|jgi:CyaY protein|uniref:Iron-sulfur cluster assembly protein CyaY n=1 Tax=Comamonas aquatica TaxID=225991 RepID=A0AA42W1J9_9BURK|nr:MULTISPECIES: iron donor protein CyaY [Comamonas]MDE1553900.1 iron donor protein CyaY [Comamonas aquatica]MDH0200271.1 iron donor protein CyaY [Comamonas aquatica]MDH0372373.1 iron donor protein CyaY [Comamonas aquatica]MDH0380918.1 iron donor protein CyaY [Comamonas aquatica]MDH0429364.1 iron donor protein CyaY [Comamonas aquatica]
MTDLEYLDRAEQLLLAVEQSCDRLNDETDADIDAQRVGGMVTLVFANRTQIVINQQKPLHEIWMAAKAGGFHYKFDGQHWQDTKGGGEFFENLSRFASAQSGLTLAFTAKTV